MNRATKAWIVVATLLLACNAYIFLAWLPTTRQTGSGQNAVDNERIDRQRSEAYVAVQDFGSAKLFSPGSAKYPAYDPSTVRALKGDEYQVTSYVDSQNPYGALIRTSYVAVLHDDSSGKWNLVNLDMKHQD